MKVFPIPFFLLLLLPLGLYAQDTDGEVFELSAFEVNTSADRGYIASNAISAYRINLPIQDIPLQIKVVTRDFLDDVKAINLEEALSYSVGVTRDVQERENGRFSIRGLQAAFPKRNGYRRYYTVDMTNVERVEVIKGPASALFGEAQPGGIINYVTKKPLVEPRYDITLTYGSYDYRRAMVEATGPLNEKKTWLYRVDASYLDRNDYRDFSYEQRTVVAPVVEWRPTERTTLKFDYEFIKRDFLPPSFSPVINLEALDFYNNLPEDGILDFKKLVVDSELRPTDDYLGPLVFLKAWGPFLPEEIIPEDPNDLLYWRDIHPDIPREWSSTGPDAYDLFESHSFTVEGNHEFGNGSSIRFAGSMATIETDYLRGRPNRVRIYGDGFYRGQWLWDAENKVTNLQADYLLPIDLGWSRHTLIFGTEFFQDEFKNLSFNGPISGTWMEHYFDESPIPSRRLRPDGSFNQFSIRGYPLEVEATIPYLKGNDPTRQDRQTLSFYLSDQAVFLKERLKVLGGVRYDRLEQTLYYYYTKTGLYQEDPLVEQWSPQIGVNFEIVDGLALYGNYSKSFSPGLGGFTRLNPDGSTSDDTRPPELGNGVEAGLKFSLLEGRLSGTMAFFDIEKQDVTITLRDGGIAYNSLVDDASTGFEIDFAYEPFSGLQFLLGYAYIDSFRNDPTAPDWVTDIVSRVPGVPNNQVTFWTKYVFSEGPLDGFSIGGGVQWMEDFRGSAALPDIIVLDGYTKVDLLLSYKLPTDSGSWKFDLFVDNILDENYYYPGPLAAYPRNYKVTLNYSF